MEEFLATALSMPTLAFTGLLGLVVLYWLSVMLGALDLEVLDFDLGADGADGAVDGALEGGAEGAMEADLEVGDVGGLAGVLSALGLRHAPLTVVLSLLVLFGWLGTFFGSRYLAPVLPLGGFLSALVVTLAALALATPLTSLLTRPMAPLFRVRAARGNRDLVGQVVKIRTGNVDARFGQAELKDGRSDMILHVRCADPEALARGDEALIVDWDEERQAFEVEPMEAILPEEGQKKRA